MVTLTAKNPTLLDFSNATDPSGKISAVVEILAEVNEVLTDMSWQEGNLATGMLTTIRTGLPEPTWRKLYGGVQPTKSTRAQITDLTGMLEAYSEVDVALADLSNNKQAFRLQEDSAHIEGMSQEMADTLFFGNQDTEPQAFTGLAPRFNSLSAENGDNIIDGLGTGSDNRSIWLVVWGPNTIHGIIPQGSMAGLKIEDLGEQLNQAASVGSNTGRMQAYVSHYRWDAGLSLRDWRYVFRIANVDFSDLTFDASAGANLPNLMFEAMDLIPSLSKGRPAFYMARGVKTILRQQMSSLRDQSTMAQGEVGGVRVDEFQGIPVRRCDALSADEAQIT